MSDHNETRGTMSDTQTTPVTVEEWAHILKRAQHDRAERIRVSRGMYEHLFALATEESENWMWPSGGRPRAPLGVLIAIDDDLTGLAWEVDPGRMADMLADTATPPE